MGEIHDEHGQDGTARKSWLVISVVVLGAVTTIIGVVLLLLPGSQASIGWFAYAPLGNTSFVPPGALLTPEHQIGIVLLAIGLASFAFAGGWALGRRNASRR